MNDEQKSWVVRTGVVVGGITFLFVIAPIIYIALQATLGLAAIGVVGILGVATIKALPYLGQKWENKLLSLRKTEARTNPIEQMQNRVLQRATQLEALKRALESIGGQITGMIRMVDKRAAEDSKQDLTAQRTAIKKMETFFITLKGKYKDAYAALADLRKEVERKQFEWEFANAGQSALKAMSVQDADNLLKDMLADEAFKSVEQRFDATFAALDMETTSLNEHDKLEFGKGVTLDLQAIQIPELIKVGK